MEAFRNGMPVRRAWKHLRSYEDCFSAREAVDWLHAHLLGDPNFGATVTREQTFQLLKKFYKAGLIEDVKSHRTFKLDNFKDNSDLYR